jgi:hypothetical protein
LWWLYILQSATKALDQSGDHRHHHGMNMQHRWTDMVMLPAADGRVSDIVPKASWLQHCQGSSGAQLCC